MKTDLEKIAAALKKLESLNNSSPQPPAKSQQGDRNLVPEQKTSDRRTPQAIAPISMPQMRKTPTLPAFNASSINEQKPHQEVAIASTEPSKAPAPDNPALLALQEQEIVQQIQELYHEGPIVDGWLESYHPSAPEQDLIIYDAAQQSVEYVEAVGSFELGKVTCEAPRSAYRLCGVHPSGQKWAHACPLEQLASVSMAIARYEKLLQLLVRRQAITARLSGVGESPS